MRKFIASYFLATISLISMACSESNIHTDEIKKNIDQLGEIKVIPLPQYVSYANGQISLPNNPTISYKGDISSEAALLKEYLKADLGMDPNIEINKNDAQIYLEIVTSMTTKGKGGYKIEINDHQIKLTAPDALGIFYGTQTIRQSIEKITDGYAIRKMNISDYPTYEWRAVMLDEGRYFKGKEAVKNIINEMARFKMNIFHWHLTEDLGWRIEIKKYPKLTEIGSKRDSTQINDGPDWSWVHNKWDGVPHEGYYTQNDIQEIVAYAAERHIDIMPEIEILTHAQAAIASYPQLGTTKQPVKVACNLGVMHEIMDVSDPFTIQFVRDILAEVADLFPYKYIHIGGDELHGDHWKNSAGIKAKKTDLGLTEDFELQIWYTNYISEYLNKTLNKHMMGWSDFVGNKDKVSKIALNVNPNDIAQYWQGTIDDLRFIMRKNLKVVQSHNNFAYFNAWMADAYKTNCIPENVSDINKKIIGIEAACWSEFDSTVDKTYDHIFPRIAAYAETGWTKPELKNYTSYIFRLQPKYNQWEALGIKYGSTDESK